MDVKPRNDDDSESNPFPGTLAHLTLLPYRSESFRADPPSNSLSVPAFPQVIVPGTADLDFRPMTASVMVTRGNGIDVTVEGIVAAGGTMNAPAFTNQGVVIQVRGIVGAGGWYLRRFSLPIFRMVQIDLSRWKDVQIELLKSTIPNASIVCTVSNRPCETTIDEVFFYGEEYGPGGVYVVPPGSNGMVPELADPGFTWITDTFGPAGLVQIPDPAVIGVPKAVKGTQFLTTVNPFRAVWNVTS